MNSSNAATPAQRILRVKDVAAIFGVSISTIYDWQAPASVRFIPEFPRRVRFGNACAGFLESDVNAYIDLCKSRAFNDA